VANFQSIAAAVLSIERLLTARFREAPVPVPGKTTRAIVVRTEDFGDPAQVLQRPCLSIFLYRVDFNKTMRAAWSAVGHQVGRAYLPVDLHLLVTPWAENAEHEHAILGRALQSLEETPILGGPLLHPSGGWAPNETVQLALEEISTEAVMRTFDSLPTDYRLSVPYVARVVRVDGRTAVPSPPVTTVVTGGTAAT
jgi:uncharacterized protein DUF4255